MKPPKPRITKPRLTWRWNRRRRTWEPYHRTTWTEGGKQRERNVKLDWKGEPARLDELYWRAESGQHQQQKAPSRYTWRECIETWRRDPQIQRKLKESTKSS